MKQDLLLNEQKHNTIINRYIVPGEMDTLRYLPNINRINLFVGANNSGKSWMIKHLLEIEHYKFFEFKNLDNLLKKYNGIISYNRTFKQNESMIYGGEQVKLLNLNLIKSNSLSDIASKLNDFMSSSKILRNYSTHRLQNYVPELDISLIESLWSMATKMIESLQNVHVVENTLKYYIPTLRTAHSLYDFKQQQYIKIEDDIFLNTLQRNYKIQNVKIFTGIHLYKEILNSRNARKDIRNKFEDFETFVQNSFFDSKKIDIVAEFDKDKSLDGDNSDEIISIHIEGENDTRKLHELGDGVQAIIILMYQIFMAEENAVIFIDEPELNLHPGMQRLFFEQLSFNKDLTKKNLMYFISTHSNHLLDLTLESDDVSIYSFNPIVENGDKKIIVKNINFGNAELLRDLGVNNTSVFLANASIWVEGISDRNYIKAFLKAYCDAEEGRVYPKEDIDFTFFEYAGGNIEHYILGEELNDNEEERFVEEINALALSNKIFLLADSDMAKEGSKKYSRLKSFEDKFSRDKNFDGLIL